MQNPIINMMPLEQRLSISKGKKKPTKSVPVRQAATSIGQKVAIMGKMGNREEALITNKGSKAKAPPKTTGRKMPLKPNMKMAQKAGKGYKGY